MPVVITRAVGSKVEDRKNTVSNPLSRSDTGNSFTQGEIASRSECLQSKNPKLTSEALAQLKEAEDKAKKKKAWEDYINPLPNPQKIEDPTERKIAELRIATQQAKYNCQRLGGLASITDDMCNSHPEYKVEEWVEKARRENHYYYGNYSPYTETKDLPFAPDGNPADFLDPFPIDPFKF